MNQIFIQILNMSITAGILALGIMLLRAVFRKIPRKYICVLWALVAIRLICPVSISSHLSVFNLLNTEQGQTGRMEYIQLERTGSKQAGDVIGNPVEEQETSGVMSEVDGQEADRGSQEERLLTERKPNSRNAGLAWVWLLGTAVMVIRAIGSYLNLRKRVEISMPIERNIYISDEIASPFVFGVLRPKVYLPSGLKESTKQYVIAHELSHLKRLDPWWKIVGYLLLCIYWFNPILWIAYILLCRDIEAACDEKAIMGMDREARAGYSEALLQCALNQRRVAVYPLAFGADDVKGRVKNVLRYKKPALSLGIISSVLCLGMAMCFLTDPIIKSAESIPEIIEAKEVDEEKTKGTVEAYRRYLMEAYQKGVIGDFTLEACGNELGLMAEFAICDVDRDGEVELLLNYFGKSSATTLGVIWGLKDGKLHQELKEFPKLTCLSDGSVEAGWSHSPVYYEDFWPYTTYRYVETTDIYEKEAEVESPEQRIDNTEDSIRINYLPLTKDNIEGLGTSESVEE